MARFTGTGQLTLEGNDSRIYDCLMGNAGGFVMNGSRQRLENCDVAVPLTVAADRGNVKIIGNRITDRIILMGGNDGLVIADNELAGDNPGGSG